MARKKFTRTILNNVLIEDLGSEGKSISRHDNKVVFSEFTAPGDVVDLEVYRSHKNYSEAKVVAFHSYSKDRVTPFCEHFGACGGCKLQHISYDVQLQHKQKQVIDALIRIGKLELPTVSPIIGSALQKGYRNKLDFSVSNKRWFTENEINTEEGLKPNAIGFHIPGRFDKVLDIQHCHHQAEPSNAIRNGMRTFMLENDYPFYDLKTNEGFLRGITIRNTQEGEFMLIVQFGKDEREWIEKTCQYLVSTFSEIGTLYYTINLKKNDSIYDLDLVLYKGKGYIEERMEALTFRISPKSFYQTNPSQAYELYKLTRSMAKLTGIETVYDLYTGTGTIANFIAHQAKKVVGIESVPMAIEDAKLNSSINNIHNTVFYAGDMKDIFTEDFIATNGKPDVIITDPPRVGMHNDVIDVLLRLEAPRIVYVSCNPATQARDLELLSEKYDIEQVQPVDMFPHTHHVENIVALQLRNSVSN
ncbi:MAG TPA: 23S rRNA (uracil(1939)-C(5))-methyltransferase RlmD [Cytophagaceae bacterium]|jgi:23S rRNA (uracil1939-C5)-methyltransferase|nr:23S rRNA (uracil(1939)-C(5))-methyltransferase RlmD [Cytophagaceae bacterium]